ncbi:MAG TPA: pyrroline-5-carboxylate reductase [Pyrinomonadaceae bacterium]|nr:pyrroline-5-carboxylate reductase [Pyrinomonadaceae bacterium]
MGNELENVHLSFIGCGVMAESMIAGLLRKQLVDAERISGSHPRETRRRELEEKYGIRMFTSNAEAAESVRETENSAVVLCVKPQRIGGVLQDLKGSVAPDGLIVSIVAGAKMETISRELGTGKVVRAMPNTPSQIGAGITAWTCTESVNDDERTRVRHLLAALGKELYVETENMIDMATSLSATGPTYIFMVMEALTDAGVHLGFSRDLAKELVQETMLGSVKFAMESHKHPAELRNMVTSPGGTSAEAIYQMEKGTLRTVLSKAVYAAYRRAVELGQKD